MTQDRGQSRGTVEQLLDDARACLDRLTPERAAAAAVGAGALLIDIRSELQRERDGVIPGSRFIPRNVLEWRCDPASRWRDRAITEPRKRLIVICNEGYQSSLAAATLQRLGLTDTTDVIGGFQAWKAAGLPVQRADTAVHPSDRSSARDGRRMTRSTTARGAPSASRIAIEPMNRKEGSDEHH